MTTLLIENLTKSYNQTLVLSNINLSVSKGDLVSFMGPSGSGKSTLLKCINALEIPQKGTISIGSETIDYVNPTNIHHLRKKIGMVFQSFNLFPHLNLLENLIKAPMVVLKESKEKAITQAMELLEKVGLQDHSKKYSFQLSGGEQQRGAIARALMMKPEIMLYDEPTSALDPERVDEVLDIMLDLKKDGLTQIIVSHEMRFVKEASDNIYFLENGIIVDMGPPDKIFSNQSHPRTQKYLRRYF